MNILIFVEYVQTHGLTIHDATGNNVELDTLLANALTDTALASQRGRFLLAMLVLLGLATFGVLSYLGPILTCENSHRGPASANQTRIGRP
jgi:hypothetical protein